MAPTTDKGYLPTDLATMWGDAERESVAATSGGPEPLTEYQADPLGFCVDVLGIPRETLEWSLNGYERHAWDGTKEPLLAVMDGLVAWDNVAVESATGTGKSFLAAALTLWFLGSFRNSRVGTYAPKEDQLREYMWAEMGKLWPRFKARFPSAILQDLALYMNGAAADDEGRENWAAKGISVAVRAGETSATKAQGRHAEHMLLILEETPGINPAIIDALENTCVSPHNLRLALGNPDAKTDTLHALFKRPSWRGIRVSALDHPNVVTGDSSIVPGAVSPKSIADRLEKYGEAHPKYQSRVRGIPPDQSESALIHLAWVEAAVLRAQEWATRLATARWPHALGADPSNSDAGDPAAVAHFIGPICVGVATRPCPNSNALGRQLWVMAQELRVVPAHIGVDPIGVGAGTVNALTELIPPGTALPRLHGGGAPMPRIAKGGERPGWVIDANLFRNLRAQMYWQLREDLRTGVIGLPDDAELHEELITPTYTDVNKVLIEDKDEVKARLGRSPNKADAVAYANWVRPRTTPLDIPVRNPDHTDLGLKKVGKRMVKITPEDIFRERNPQMQPQRGGVRRWW